MSPVIITTNTNRLKYGTGKIKPVLVLVKQEIMVWQWH